MPGSDRHDGGAHPPSPAPAAGPETAEGGRPANRAERRAAARGRGPGGGSGPAVPRSSGPAPHAKPAHVRTDFTARRGG